MKTINATIVCITPKTSPNKEGIFITADFDGKVERKNTCVWCQNRDCHEEQVLHNEIHLDKNRA